MELSDLLKRRRMVHHFEPRPLPTDVLDRILESALHAPSGGFSQGLALIVLDDPAQVAWFWETTGGNQFSDPAPVIVLPIPDKRAYLERYSHPDKEGRMVRWRWKEGGRFLTGTSTPPWPAW